MFCFANVALDLLGIAELYLRICVFAVFVDISGSTYCSASLAANFGWSFNGCKCNLIEDKFGWMLL
jgi:hypothetical protein